MTHISAQIYFLANIFNFKHFHIHSDQNIFFKSDLHELKIRLKKR